MILASECSSKFAKIIGKGNPVAVLATMILLSYTKFFNAVLASLSLLYWQPAYDSHNVKVAKFYEGDQNIILMVADQSDDPSIKAATYFLLIISALILPLCVIFTVLLFSWQWLLRYQDKPLLSG